MLECSVQKKALLFSFWKTSSYFPSLDLKLILLHFIIIFMTGARIPFTVWVLVNRYVVSIMSGETLM